MASRDVEFVLRARDEGKQTIEQSARTFERLAEATREAAETARRGGDAIQRLSRDLDSLAARKAAVDSVAKLADSLKTAETRTKALADKLPELQAAEKASAEAAKKAADALAQRSAAAERAKAAAQTEIASLAAARESLAAYTAQVRAAENAIAKMRAAPKSPGAAAAGQDALANLDGRKRAADEARLSVERLTKAVEAQRAAVALAAREERAARTAATATARAAERQATSVATAASDHRRATEALAALKAEAASASTALGGVAIREDALRAASATLAASIDRTTEALKRQRAAAKEAQAAVAAAPNAPLRVLAAKEAGTYVPAAAPSAQSLAGYRARAAGIPSAQNDLNVVREAYTASRRETTTLGRSLASSPTAEQVAAFNTSRQTTEDLRQSYYAASRTLRDLTNAETARRVAAQASAEAERQTAAAARQAAAAAREEADAVNAATRALRGKTGFAQQGEFSRRAFTPTPGQLQNTATVEAGRAVVRTPAPDPTPLQRFVGVANQARAAILGTGRAAEESGNLFKVFGARTVALVAAFAGFHAIKNQIEAVGETIRVMDAAANRLGVVMGGSTARAAQEFSFLTAEARRLGIPMRELLDYYGRFAMAGQEVGLTNEQTRKSFVALMETARVAKLSENERNRLFIAADDVLSKGKLQAQEVRQFSNVVPGASHIMARALGMTRPELSTAMQRGAVDVTPEAYMRMMEGFGSRFSPQVGEATKTTTAEIDKLKQSLFEMQAAFAEGGFSEGLRTALAGLNEEMAKPESRQAMRDLGATVGELAKSFVGAIPAIIEFGKVAAVSFAAFAVWRGAGLVISGVNAALGIFGAVAAGVRTTSVALKAGGSALTALSRGAVVARIALTGLGYSIPVVGQVVLAITALGAAWAWWTSKAHKAPDLTNAVAETKNKLTEIQQAYKENGESIDGLQEKVRAKGWKVADVEKDFGAVKRAFDESKRQLVSDTEVKIKTKLDTSGLDPKEADGLKAALADLTSGQTNVQQFTDSLKYLRDATESLKGQKFLSSIIEQANKTGALEDQMTKAALVAKTLGSTQAEVDAVMRKYNMTLVDLVKNHDAFTESMRKSDRASSEFGAAMQKVDEHIRKSAQGAAKYQEVVKAVVDGQNAVNAALKEQAAAESALKIARTAREKEVAQDALDKAKQNVKIAQEKQPQAVKAAAEAASGIERTDEENRKIAFGLSERDNQAVALAEKNIAVAQERLSAAKRSAANASNEDDRKISAERIAAQEDRIREEEQKIAQVRAKAIADAAMADADAQRKRQEAAAEAQKAAEKQKAAREKFNSEFDADVQQRRRKAAEEVPERQATARLENAKKTGVGMEDAQAELAAIKRERAINDAVAKEVERARSRADRLGQDFQIDPGRLEVLRQMAAAEYDAKQINEEQAQAKERLAAWEKILGDLVARRKDLESQIVTGREQGTRSPEEIAALQQEYGKVTLEAGKAADEAERLATSLGDRKAVDHIRTQRDSLVEYQKGLLDLNSLGGSFADGMVGAFEKTAGSLADAISGTKKWGDAWRGVADAFRAFASDFLMTIAKMILKQALLNALGLGEKRASDKDTGGGIIGALKQMAPSIGGTPLFGGSVPVNPAVMAGGAGGGGGVGLPGVTSPLYGPKTIPTPGRQEASVPALLAGAPSLSPEAKTPAARSTAEAAALGEATKEAAVKAGIPAKTAAAIGSDAAQRAAIGGGVPPPPTMTLPRVTPKSLGLRGTLSETPQESFAAPAAPSPAAPGGRELYLSEQEQIDLAKTLSTEWNPSVGKDQGRGIIDTILNRKMSGRWGDSVTDVVNARKQFSDINGPVSWKQGRRSVSDIPDSILDKGKGLQSKQLVDEYLAERAAGRESIVGGHLNYANRKYSSPSNYGWIDKLTGPRFGSGNSVHQHGTVAGMRPVEPYAVRLAGSAPRVDPQTTASITPPPADQALADQQQEAARVATENARQQGEQSRQAFEQQQAAQVAQEDAVRRQQLDAEQQQAAQAQEQQLAQEQQVAFQQEQMALQTEQMQNMPQPVLPQMPDMSGMFSGMMSSVSGMIGGGQNGMLGGVMSLAPKLLQMLLGGMFGGGGFGSLFGGLFHSGGVVGAGMSTGRMVPAGAFASAVRYHSGGLVGFAPDERAAVLQTGEEVLTRNDPRNRANGMTAAGGKEGGNGVNVYLVHDQGEAMRMALETPHGTEAIIQHVGNNRDAYKGALKS